MRRCDGLPKFLGMAKSKQPHVKPAVEQHPHPLLPAPAPPDASLSTTKRRRVKAREPGLDAASTPGGECAAAPATVDSDAAAGAGGGGGGGAALDLASGSSA